MPYPRRLLNQGEEVALDLKPHWWFFSKQVIAGSALVVVFVLVVGLDNGLAWWAWGVLALVWAGWLGVAYVSWAFTYFVVTSARVIYRTGVLARRGVEIPLDRVNNITFTQTLWERVIGAGDLEIESAGEHGLSNFEDVRHPDAVQQEIYRQMEANAKKRASWIGAGSVAAAGERGARPSIPEQIQQLADLRDRGIISAAEFEAKKAQLLERM
jgi:uncharacterized membrane protein YdbT with pleckstrin-like domain